MEFIKEKKIKLVTMGTFSQSFGKSVEECKLKAWFTARDRKKAYNMDSRPLQVGICAKEGFAKNVAEFVGEPHLENRSKAFSASVRYEGKMLLKRSPVFKFVDHPDNIMGYNKSLRFTLSCGVELLGLFDLFSLKENADRGTYLEVLNITTSHTLSGEDRDIQSLIAAFLTAEMYGMNVNFVRYSCRTGERKEEFYYHKDALAAREILEDAAIEAKKMIESDDKPRPTASSKCLECPFLDDCTAKDNEVLCTEDLMNEYLWATAKAKQAETALKNLREFSEEDIVLGGMRIIIRESKRRTLKAGTKKLTKKDLINLILADGTASTFLEHMDIDYSNEVLDKAQELGLTIETGITSKIAITADKDSEESEEGEAE